jgi:hypothetical protein
MHTLASNEKMNSAARNIRNALNSFFEVAFFEKLLRMHGYNIWKACGCFGCIRSGHTVVPIAAPSAHGRAGSNVIVGKDG